MPVATNAMHFQCTHSPSPKIYSTSSRIHIWNPVGGLRWSCFSRGAPSMFDGILNAMLCLRRFPSLGLHKEIFELPLPPNFLDLRILTVESLPLIQLLPLPCTPACSHEFHALAAQPTPLPRPSFQIDSTAQSDLHLEAGRKSAMKRFCGNSQSVKSIGCFSGGAPSLISDGILNVIP